MAGALEKIDAILLDLEKMTGCSSFCSGKARFTVGYWAVRGLAQPARLMLAYGGQCDFENVTYKFGPPPDYSRNDWFDVKFTMKLEFPNLPYLIDHQYNVRLSESSAIYRYLARELQIGSKDSQGIAREEMLGDVVKELSSQFAKINYSPDFEKLKGQYVKDLPNSLQPLEHYLKGKKTQRKWLGGDDLCYADFLLFEFLETSFRFCPDVYKSFSELTRFHKAFKALHPLQDFFNSDMGRYPGSGPIAHFQ